MRVITCSVWESDLVGGRCAAAVLICSKRELMMTALSSSFLHIAVSRSDTVGDNASMLAMKLRHFSSMPFLKVA